MIESRVAQPVNTETHHYDVPEGDCATGSHETRNRLDTLRTEARALVAAAGKNP